MAQVTWKCPNGCQGVRGPSRPRKNDVRRYCLRCSERTGRLVERISPVVEKQRAQAREKSQTKAKRKQTRTREAARRLTHIRVREVDGSMGEIDVKRTIKRMLKLSIMNEYRSHNYYWRNPPKVNVRYSTSKPYTSGHAWIGSREFTITVAANPHRIEVEEVLLHELVHLVAPREAHHGSTFRRINALAAREYWPGSRVRADEGNIWEFGHRIIEEATRVTEGILAQTST